MVMIDLGRNGQTISAESWEEVLTWIDKEQAYWDWLLPNTADPSQFATNYRNQWKALRADAVNRQARGEPVDHARHVFEPFGRGALFTHESENGALVLDIRNTVGEIEAIYACAFLAHALPLDQVRNPAGLAGVILTAMPDMRKASDLEKRLKNERANYRSSLKQAMSAVETFRTEQGGEFQDLFRRAKRLGIRALKKQKDYNKQIVLEARSEANKATASLRETENTFRAFMELQAPVEYWNDKATEHKKNRRTMAISVALYFVVLIAALSSAFYQAGSLVQELHTPGGNEPVVLYLLITGGLAILSTVGFWIGRILTKLYLSEHHLKIDAEERAVMTKTYLALSESGNASENERQIILTALFRGSTDGIIRDDGPPDMALQAIASRLLTSSR